MLCYYLINTANTPSQRQSQSHKSHKPHKSYKSYKLYKLHNALQTSHLFGRRSLITRFSCMYYQDYITLN